MGSFELLLLSHAFLTFKRFQFIPTLDEKEASTFEEEVQIGRAFEVNSDSAVVLDLRIAVPESTNESGFARATANIAQKIQAAVDSVEFIVRISFDEPVLMSFESNLDWQKLFRYGAG